MKIQKYLDPVWETAVLISYGLDADKIREEHIQSLNKVGINGILFYDRYLDGHDRYVRSFMRNRIIMPDDVIFSRNNSEFGNFVISLFFLERNLIKNIEQFSESLLRHLIAVCYNEHYETDHFLSEKPTTDELFMFAAKTNFSESMKWQFFALLKDPKPYYRQLCRMIENNLPAYEKARKECKKYIEQGLQYFVENSDWNDLTGDVEEIIPMAALPVSFIAMKNTCCLGMYWKAASKTDILSDIDNEKLPAALKAISDKSRLEILSLLKHSSMYSLEIAEKLELTPATVSHHMTTLIISNLVTLEKRGGRIYYQLNHETISALIKQLENKIL